MENIPALRRRECRPAASGLVSTPVACRRRVRAQILSPFRYRSSTDVPIFLRRTTFPVVVGTTARGKVRQPRRQFPLAVFEGEGPRRLLTFLFLSVRMLRDS